MRWIKLEGTDAALFDKDVTEGDVEYFIKHKETVKCMWTDQGKKFWIRFVITFRWYSVNHGILGLFLSPKHMTLNHLVDQIFIFIHENFIDAKYSQALNLLQDTMTLSLNKGLIPFLGTKPISRDPFYAKDTRDVYRRLFGDPKEKLSYMNASLFVFLYVKFGGAVMGCLKLWLNAPPLHPSDESYWIPPQNPKHCPASKKSTKKKKAPGSQTEEPGKLMLKPTTKNITGVTLPAPSASSCDKTDLKQNLHEDSNLFLKELVQGCPFGPKYLKGWCYGDPRFVVEANPLYNPSAEPILDWRKTLTDDQFKSFVDFVQCTFPCDKPPNTSLLQYHPDLMIYPPPKNRRIYDEVERSFLECCEKQFKLGVAVPGKLVAAENLHTHSTKTFSELRLNESGDFKLVASRPSPGPFDDWTVTDKSKVIVIRQDPKVEGIDKTYNLLDYLLMDSKNSNGGLGALADVHISVDMEGAAAGPKERSCCSLSVGCESVATESFKNVLDAAKSTASKHVGEGDGIPGAKRSGKEASGEVTKCRKCRNCEKPEPEPRLFKKCQRCKVEKVARPCYYCSRDCQVVDWNERHCQEHMDGLL